MFNVIILGLASFLTDISSEMVYPLLPLFLTSARIGASPAIVGIIEGLAESTASLIRVFSGYFSDRLGARKPVAIVGYAASTVGKFFLYIAASWQIVLVGRLSDRFGKGIRTAPRDALIADSTPPEKRGAAYGLHRALDSSGAVIGVILAYVLFVSVREDFSAIFLFSLIPAALGVVVLFLAREKRAAARQDFRSLPNFASLPVPWWQNLGARWHALDRKLKAFLILIFVFTLGNSSNQFLVLRAKNLGYSDATAILLYLAYNVTYALVSYPAGRLSDRIGRKTLLVAGYLTYGLVYFAFALATPGALWFLFPIYGLYIALTEGVEKALVSDLAPKDLRATLIGLHATFTGIGLLPASALAGVLWNVFGASAPFYFGGAMGVLAAVGLAMMI
jgi:MFS family permease